MVEIGSIYVMNNFLDPFATHCYVIINERKNDKNGLPWVKYRFLTLNEDGSFSNGVFSSTLEEKNFEDIYLLYKPSNQKEEITQKAKNITSFLEV